MFQETGLRFYELLLGSGGRKLIKRTEIRNAKDSNRNVPNFGMQSIEEILKLMKERLRMEKLLNLLQLLVGVFDLIKKISWRILSFFIVYLALVGYTALENPMSLREMVRNPDFSEDYFMIGVCLVFLAESIKIIATKLPMECGVAMVSLLVISLFCIMAGYSPENFGVMVLIYLSAATLEWVCGKVILFLYKRQGTQITEERTEIRNVKKGIENGNDISRS